MTEEEKQLVQAAFAGGPAALLDAGMTPAEVKSFITRTDVASSIQLLTEELGLHEALTARQRFLARRALSRLVPQAVQMLADTMRGVVYETDSQGNVKTKKVKKGKGKTAIEYEEPIIKHKPPSDYQLSAAQDVLDRMGIQEKATTEQGAGVSVQVMFGSIEKDAVQLDYGKEPMTEQQKIIIRELARVTIEKLSGKIPDAIQKLSHITQAGSSVPGKGKKVVSKAVKPVSDWTPEKILEHTKNGKAIP